MSAKLPGTGQDCECGEHRLNCAFGRDHGWMTYLPQAAIGNFGIAPELAHAGSWACWTCNAICTLD